MTEQEMSYVNEWNNSAYYDHLIELEYTFNHNFEALLTEEQGSRSLLLEALLINRYNQRNIF